ncbi:PH domain-containing protein [Streptomyces endophyticus]|uniref:PH domain-containing protein n=1 Tax=Streptomyces endophyticus TaxID=714166 RepID=A0ABU6FEY2_9ACTN|nr:PH domain-containing protein [Streptomyces endophyticus]MEB8342594.1 PH domain-containing protein [Streptomyces endophyticus]
MSNSTWNNGTVHSGDEQTLWDVKSQNATAVATSGRVALKYKLTTHYLYFETGGVTGTKQEQVPLIHVHDVDVSQSLIQKSRKVGNVLVHVVRDSGLRETAVLDSIPEPIAARDSINRAVHQMRGVVHQHRKAEQQQLNTHRFDVTPGSATMPAPTMAGVPMPPAQPAADQDPQAVMGLLRQLGELRDSGILTADDFEAKKVELLSRL